MCKILLPMFPTLHPAGVQERVRDWYALSSMPFLQVLEQPPHVDQSPYVYCTGQATPEWQGSSLTESVQPLVDS